MTDTYFVVGYRWGATNAGHIFLYCGQDLDKAVCRADWYTNYRGGKYGCAVYRLDEFPQMQGEDDEEPIEVLVHYSPSGRGENEPYVNKRIELMEKVGCHVVGRIEAPAIYKETPIEEVIRRERAILDIMYPEKEESR